MPLRSRPASRCSWRGRRTASPISSIARTVGPGGNSFLSRPRAVAIGLGCEIDYARQTVYSIGLNLDDPDAADPIGPGCRTCERGDCRHRAVPPLGRSLDVGNAERGVLPYRIIE